MPAPTPESGFNFFLPWGLIEWALTGITTAGAGVVMWVWRQGSQVDALTTEVNELRAELIQMNDRMEAVEVRIDDRLVQAEQARMQMKIEMLEKLNTLPTRVQLESQFQQLSGRMDGIIDAKLRQRD